MSEPQETYEVGHTIKNPETGDGAVFAGYDENGNETWCDICSTPWGKDGLNPPETKTFQGFNGSWIRWKQSVEDFAAAVSHTH